MSYLIDYIKTFIEFILFRMDYTAKKIPAVCKVFGKGFEKMIDLESEIKAIRQQLNESSIKRC